MSNQPDALRLAEWFEGGLGGCELEAAAELRRLHADNKRICSALNGWIRENSPGGWIDALRTQRNALLEALRYWLPDETMIPAGHEAKWNEAVAALRAALAQPSPATLFDPRGSLGEPIV